jgi:hypothetical protein
VSSLALPYRVALVALLAIAALWFTVLRPKPVEGPPAPPPAAPGATGLGNAVEGAQSAVETANAAAQRSADAAGAAAATPATGTSASRVTPGTQAQRRAASAGDASTPILRQLDRGRVVALLFYNGRGSDDRAVRRAVRALPRRDGRVVVKTAPISRLGRYEAITRGVQVLAAPTVLVIGQGPSARTITGFTTTAEVNQVVDDMLELSGGEPAPALEERRAVRHARELCGTGPDGAGCREHLAQANRICAQMSEDGFARAAVAGGGGGPSIDVATALGQVRTRFAASVTQFTALKPPAARAKAHAAAGAVLRSQVGQVDRIVKRVSAAPDQAAAFTQVTSALRGSPRVERQNRRLRTLGYDACGA